MATKVGNRLKLLWTEVSTITKYELREHLFSLLEKKSDEFLHIVTLNAEIVMQSHKDIELRDALKTSEVLVPDGVSIIMAIKMLYGQQIERIRGIDLIYDLADVAVQTKSPVFLLGSTSNVSSRAVEKLRSL